MHGKRNSFLQLAKNIIFSQSKESVYYTYKPKRNSSKRQCCNGFPLSFPKSILSHYAWKSCSYWVLWFPSWQSIPWWRIDYLLPYPIPIACALKRFINLSVEKILWFTIWLRNLQHSVKTFGPFLKQNFFEKSTFFLQGEKKKSPFPILLSFFWKKFFPLRTWDLWCSHAPGKFPVQLPIIAQLWFTPWTSI